MMPPPAHSDEKVAIVTGRIDTLINNAGIYIGKPFTHYTLEDYVGSSSGAPDGRTSG
jgi:NADP-dependent 3-hydroxy acid dehydrogenase YdfG